MINVPNIVELTNQLREMPSVFVSEGVRQPKKKVRCARDWGEIRKKAGVGVDGGGGFPSL